MKPIIIRGNVVPALMSVFISVTAITLWPFVFIRSDVEDEDRVINHESIHMAQYWELWVVPFLFVYVWDFFRGWFKYRDTHKAYRSIRFEQEAFANDRNLNYLKNRKSFRWRDYEV